MYSAAHLDPPCERDAAQRNAAQFSPKFHVLYYDEKGVNDVDTYAGIDEHDEPADEMDRAHAYLRRTYGGFDDGVLD